MNRRQLLISLMALAVSQTGCQRSSENQLRVLALRNTVPSQVLRNLNKVLPNSAKVKLKTARSFTNLFQQLQDSKKVKLKTARSFTNLFQRFQNSQLVTPPAGAAWVSLNDYWLTAAIQQQLIRPLAVGDFAQWTELPAIWRSLLQRDGQGLVADSGQIWAAPYRWGQLMLVYNQPSFERLGWQPTQWKDLWHPDLAGQILLPNHPRLVLGIVLKSLGYSANDLRPDQHSAVLAALKTLQPQVKSYASSHYLEPLITNDAQVAVGWSTEIRPAIAQYSQLIPISPEPGTLLTADVWVKPAIETTAQLATLSAIDQTWLSYWWQPEVVAPLSLFSNGLSPLLLQPKATPATDVPAAKVLLPSKNILENSEFIFPLPPEAIERYDSLWRTLRGGE